jgi:ABC-2 type transport system permease protein
MIAKSTAAELVKLRGLPSVIATGLATVAAAIGLSAAVAAVSTVADPVQVTLRTIPFLQVGPILIGVLAVATEYAGRQIRTTLTATPNRPVVLIGKSGAALAAAVITSVGAVGAGIATAWLTLTVRNVPPPPDVDGGPAVGAVVYLVLIGLLGFVLTVLVRALVPSLVTMLSLVLVASPLLSAVTEAARYLPDRAGGLLYLPGADAVLTPASGTLVLLGWVAVVGAAATVAFLLRDA